MNIKNKAIAISALALCVLTLSACVRLHADAKTNALFNAAKTNNAAEARRLIADGADVNAQSYFGITVLMTAAVNNAVNVVRLLLADVIELFEAAGAKE